MEHINTQEWKTHFRKIKDNNEHMWNRELFRVDYIKKVHIIMVSDAMQLVFHKNLHVNLHYSISNKKHLKMIQAFCKFSGIDVIGYNNDTSYYDFDNVVVSNSFEHSQIKSYQNKLQATNLMNVLSKIGRKVKKTSTVGWSIAPSCSRIGSIYQNRNVNHMKKRLITKTHNTHTTRAPCAQTWRKI